MTIVMTFHIPPTTKIFFHLHFISHTFNAQVFECPTEESEMAIYVNIIRS